MASTEEIPILTHFLIVLFALSHKGQRETIHYLGFLQSTFLEYPGLDRDQMTNEKKETN